MIKYRLICDTEHEFDGWFPTSREFSKQKKMGQLTCPVCDSRHVDKALMSPGVSRSKNARRLAQSRDGAQSPDQMMPASQAKHVLKKIGQYITKNFENVGDRFYSEAVRCEEGDRDDRFYGTPTKEETDKLLDEGIDLFHVPRLKDN
jgi:hypothetical protein